MIFGDSGMTSPPRRSWYDPASTTKGTEAVRRNHGHWCACGWRRAPSAYTARRIRDRTGFIRVDGHRLILRIRLVLLVERDSRDDVSFEDVVEIFGFWTKPKTVYSKSRRGLSTRLMKNCASPVSRPRVEIPTEPRVWDERLISSRM